MNIQVVALFSLVVLTAGHGLLKNPPSRSSMWRYGYDTPKNFEDNQLFCGGYINQWDVNGGKCGICGDPWQGPRDNEAGGKYAKGIITRNYKTGSVIDVFVEVTANHLGYFEFRLCPNNDVTKPASQQCLDRYLLPLADGSGTKYQVSSSIGDFFVKLKLPGSLTCAQCVLQWRYRTGNSWGMINDTYSCLGCGPQEEFYGCADIAISANGSHSSSVESNTFPDGTRVYPPAKMLHLQRPTAAVPGASEFHPPSKLMQPQRPTERPSPPTSSPSPVIVTTETRHQAAVMSTPRIMDSRRQQGTNMNSAATLPPTTVVKHEQAPSGLEEVTLLISILDYIMQDRNNTLAILGLNGPNGLPINGNPHTKQPISSSQAIQTRGGHPFSSSVHLVRRTLLDQGSPGSLHQRFPASSKVLAKQQTPNWKNGRNVNKQLVKSGQQVARNNRNLFANQFWKNNQSPSHAIQTQMKRDTVVRPISTTNNMKLAMRSDPSTGSGMNANELYLEQQRKLLLQNRGVIRGKIVHCRAVGQYGGIKEANDICVKTCLEGICPPSLCECL